MSANPNGFDHYRLGRIIPGFRGKVDNTGFDYYRLGRILNVLVTKVAAATPAQRLRMLLGVGR
jgi:hypothetical protein